mmetsp:Transcript_94989/g.305857  ORF Transcript_94989/g.305857 Transcript_94989/m.305857 type:complete len:329 (-) Transcript_94989:505-1491(-)
MLQRWALAVAQTSRLLRPELGRCLETAGSLRPLAAAAAFSAQRSFVTSVKVLRTECALQVAGVRQLSTAKPEVLANGDIPFPRVRVVDDAGLVGDFMLSEALALARQRRTDLVVLSGAVDPPLCRLISIAAFLEELDSQQAERQQRAMDRKLREFSFDPSMKVKGMRFTAMVDEHDLERKVNQVRGFLEKGHRVEARILQGRCPAEDVVDLALRIIAEVRDISKPEYLEESIREFRAAYVSPKSLKRAGKAAPDEMRLRLWPCTPEQAAAFTLPAHILGPRRRRGPVIAGIDDENQQEDAWMYNRKPRDRKKGHKRSDLMTQAGGYAD